MVFQLPMGFYVGFLNRFIQVLPRILLCYVACFYLPCSMEFLQLDVMRHAGLEESKAGVKIAGRNINNLRYADDTTLMAESEEELRSLITKVKEESAKAGLQLNIKKTKIMATTPIDNWQIEGENVEAVTDFIFLGTKITADADCSQEIRILLGRRAMANLDKIVKSRDITLAMKARIVKAMVFPIVTYGCESWTIRKAERRKIIIIILVAAAVIMCIVNITW
uniref:Reverse transcriptase domain-containing protein n=1 Tax=Anolis carolinensis TaxID=28377 RepID=A0A803T3S3_ANOCA